MRAPYRTLLAVLVPAASISAASASGAAAAEVAKLTEANWDRLAPHGKEVDAIYGDHVLRSDTLVAVIARAVPTRNANLTVKRVGGCVLDFTRVDAPNDQLSCFYPHGGGYELSGPVPWPDAMPRTNGAGRLAFTLAGPGDRSLPGVVVGYELADGADYLTVRSLVTNRSGEPLQPTLADGVRADGEFTFGVQRSLNYWWAADDHWRQAYGLAVVSDGYRVRDGEPQKRRPRPVHYDALDERALKPGESILLERRLYPAVDGFALMRRVAAARQSPMADVAVTVTSDAEPVAGATVLAINDDGVVAAGRTDAAGELTATAPPGDYRWRVESLCRSGEAAFTLRAGQPRPIAIDLPATGRVAGTVVDDRGEHLPARVAFYGLGVPDPHWGPESAVHGVKNLWHTHNGRFEVEMLPGAYQMIISYGPEHNAVVKQIAVAAGETTRVAERLPRVVDTTGWLSAELHSHSSPSGDNTASQRGRVLNLLVDHLEFIPCTEHQRIDSYESHLQHFGATGRVLTCTGIELTGTPLPINHQNVFPLQRRPRTQDGGAPVIDDDPEVQIARIAMWDDRSDKVVQINHPNIPQMLGDRDQDGAPDRGFRRMFYYADVIEVHPPELIFGTAEELRPGFEDFGNMITNWMQLLNQGYRVPGVVNTDAHWNYYGSGWLRTYIRCPTDNPARADLMAVCHAIERGATVMTNGPFLEVEASAGGKTVGPGGDLVGGAATVWVRVQCPNWLDVNRVQLFVNGRPAPGCNFLRSSCDKFGDGVVKFEHTFDVAIDEDAHLIVATAAEGRGLGLVYGRNQGRAMPVAVSNPVYIDTAGDGWTPNRDKLDLPLPVEPAHKPTHGHRHVQPTRPPTQAVTSR